MKKQIIILSLFLTGIFTSFAQEEYCDTLKLKTKRTYYIYTDEDGKLYRMGDLNGAVLNIDSFPKLTPEMILVNISNDTFSSDVIYRVFVECYAVSDTNVYGYSVDIPEFSIGRELRPDDSVRAAFTSAIDLLSLINILKTVYDINFEEIDYWQTRIGAYYTSKDGNYSERAFLEGMNISTFYLIKTPVSIQEITDNNQADISVFPNPASSHFTVTNTENANIQIYNMQGQKIKQVAGEEENTVIQTSDLSAGMYVLKLEKKDAIQTKKIQIVK